ncbi:MAG: aminodeoxychorismate synthase component I [Bacteroidota bacterium]
MKILLIDNYDSFTYNLFQQIARVSGVIPIVRQNDQIELEGVRQLAPDAIILSPGPGHPARETDFGVCASILQQLNVPTFGVCLGFQGMVCAAGGEVIRAPEPRHGRLSKIQCNDPQMFAACPPAFSVVRYHSLIAAKPLPERLQPTAWTEDGLVMALKHREKNFWGVQYHPESISTEWGDQLILNFFQHFFPEKSFPLPNQVLADSPTIAAQTRLQFEKFALHLPADQLFSQLYGEEKNSFWLDSCQAGERKGRFSYLGKMGEGPEDFRLDYDAARQIIVREDQHTRQHIHQALFDYLEEILGNGRVTEKADLPFPFQGGLVGSLGYELKQDVDADAALPYEGADATLLMVSRYLVIDHVDNQLYLVAVDGEKAWLAETKARIGALQARWQAPIKRRHEQIRFSLNLSHQAYLAAIQNCQEEIFAGESYEVCLTNHFSTQSSCHPLALYQMLRKSNPAPYAAWLNFGDWQILSSSPEQFLELNAQKEVSTKPIKGTIRRVADAVMDKKLKAELQHSEKDRSENLMIVDLLRNDLGKVCEIDSVHVPTLMGIESFETVHQMVSTVKGRLNADKSMIDVLRAGFPGGSITGAPKKRSMEIIDREEKLARGVYTGSIGFLSLTGSAGLNIAIRTMVNRGEELSFGSGGAIVALSDPEAEFAEILLKAFPLIRAVALCRNGAFRAKDIQIEGLDEALKNALFASFQRRKAAPLAQKTMG